MRLTRTTSLEQDTSYDEFVGAAWPRLRWTAYMLTGDEQTAEDLAQTALVKTYAVWARVRREDAMAYTRKVLVNANIDRLRRRHLTEVSGLDDADAGPPDRSAEGHRIDDRDHLVRLLAGLTRRERTVLVLRYYHDLSEASVADELGISVGTVKSTASKALAKLRGRDDAATVRGVG